ncbi:MAG: CHAP domain-containing protein [Acetobacteraceae bacterium]
MRARATGGKGFLFRSLLVLTSALASPVALASPHHGTKVANATHHSSRSARSSRYSGKRRVAAWYGISCVPFARNESGIDLPGNARDWWDNAVGVYARGRVPKAGSVLAFTANPRMRLGHVAVVQQVVNAREIEVDQANWGPGGRVSRDVAVVDVSEDNDWTAVRVELGDGGQFGAVYPTHGFIYDRPDSGVMLASAAPPAPEPLLNPAPRDLRSMAELDNEVAEAPGPAPLILHRPLHLGHALHVSMATHHYAAHRVSAHKRR